MEKETITKMLYWLRQYPESAHPNDDERFYEFVDAITGNEQGILDEDCFYRAIVDTKQTHRGSIADAEQFYDIKSSQIEHMINFIKFRENKNKKQQ